MAKWKCTICGHIVVGAKAPDVCPVWKHPQAYFKVRKENYLAINKTEQSSDGPKKSKELCSSYF